jgi:hypothetical protein
MTAESLTWRISLMVMTPDFHSGNGEFNPPMRFLGRNAQNWGYGAAWCGHSTVTGENQDGSLPLYPAWSSSELNAVWESAENQNLSLCPCSLIVESLFCTQRAWMQFPPWALSTFGREGRRGPHKTVQTGAVPVRCIG